MVDENERSEIQQQIRSLAQSALDKGLSAEEIRAAMPAFPRHEGANPQPAVAGREAPAPPDYLADRALRLAAEFAEKMPGAQPLEVAWYAVVVAYPMAVLEVERELRRRLESALPTLELADGEEERLQRLIDEVLPVEELDEPAGL